MVYVDYEAISFTDTQTSYSFVDDSTNFLADEILFYSDQDCYIRFKADDSTQILIVAETWMTFDTQTKQIWVVRVTDNGTLKVWGEGRLVA